MWRLLLLHLQPAAAALVQPGQLEVPAGRAGVSAPLGTDPDPKHASTLPAGNAEDAGPSSGAQFSPAPSPPATSDTGTHCGVSFGRGRPKATTGRYGVMSKLSTAGETPECYTAPARMPRCRQHTPACPPKTPACPPMPKTLTVIWLREK